MIWACSPWPTCPCCKARTVMTAPPPKPICLPPWSKPLARPRPNPSPLTFLPTKAWPWWRHPPPVLPLIFLISLIFLPHLLFLARPLSRGSENHHAQNTQHPQRNPHHCAGPCRCQHPHLERWL